MEHSSAHRTCPATTRPTRDRDKETWMSMPRRDEAEFHRWVYGFRVWRHWVFECGLNRTDEIPRRNVLTPPDSPAPTRSNVINRQRQSPTAELDRRDLGSFC